MGVLVPDQFGHLQCQCAGHGMHHICIWHIYQQQLLHCVDLPGDICYSYYITLVSGEDLRFNNMFIYSLLLPLSFVMSLMFNNANLSASVSGLLYFMTIFISVTVWLKQREMHPILVALTVSHKSI